jgi:RNA polymerase sigma factor (sigma-70 family)
MHLTVDHILYAQKLATLFLRRHDVRESAEDDIRSAAVYGLLIASRRYDPVRGVKLETFAFPHVVYRMRRAAEYAERLPTNEPTEAECGTWDDLDSWVFLSQVADVINELPPKQRAVAWLYFFEDASPLQIEQRTGIGQRAVQFQKEQAIATLRGMLRGGAVKHNNRNMKYA